MTETQTAEPVTDAPPAPTVTRLVTEFETWKNPGAGRVSIRRLDHRGEPTRDELIRPGQVFTVTPTERELNQTLAFKPEMDMFTNGTLAPVRLIDGSEMARLAASNPNLLSEGDMRTMVAARGKGPAKAEIAAAFAERLGEIGNATTLRRLLTMAQEEDAAYSRVLAIEHRLAVVEGPGYEPAGSPDDDMEGPQATPPNAPAMGNDRRSADAIPGSRPVTTR